MPTIGPFDLVARDFAGRAEDYAVVFLIFGSLLIGQEMTMQKNGVGEADE